MTNPKLSIIVPSYNEVAKFKERAISTIEEYLKKQSYSYEVIIVDDKSTNNTLEFVKKLIKNKPHFRLIENDHGGKAITVMTGMLESRGEVALFTDMDQATPIAEVGKLLDKIDQGADIAIGSRRGRRGAPVARKLAGWGFSLLRNVILGLPFTDTQCGFKAFRRDVTRSIFPQLLEEWKRMRASSAAVNAGFDVETLFLAKKKGFKVTEVEVEWQHVENIKQVQLINDSLEALKDMFRIRLNELRGVYV